MDSFEFKREDMRKKYESWKKIVTRAKSKKDEISEIPQRVDCPSCLRKTLEVITVQLRGLDEGQNVLERCSNCDYHRSIRT